MHLQEHRLALAIATGLLTTAAVDAQSSLNVSSLDGTNGFAINGVASLGLVGYAVSSAGDFNGDGIGDLIIGARDVGFPTESGKESYLVFGNNQGFAPTLEVADLNGANGFTINGINAVVLAGDFASGGGDINGDGLDDIVIASNYANSSDGAAYVIFGFNNPLVQTIDISTLSGIGGFVIHGVEGSNSFGRSVGIGQDVNGDMLADLIIGEPSAGTAAAGLSHILFGDENFPASLDVTSLNGITGFSAAGVADDDRSGRATKIAGDVNGDGFGDLVIGAYGADPGGETSAGSSYVLFGSDSSFSAINLAVLNGQNGFAVNGGSEVDIMGVAVDAAGDVNGDGFDDVIMSAYAADPNGVFRAGEAYVIFGSGDVFPASFTASSMLPEQGFTIAGVYSRQYVGRAVSGAGDINGDGFDDVIVSAPIPNQFPLTPTAHVVFGSAEQLPTSISVSELSGSNGFTVTGLENNGVFGQVRTVSLDGAGDVNGDGIDDVVIGTPYADVDGSNVGQSFVVFGNATPQISSPTLAISTLPEDLPDLAGSVLLNAVVSVYQDNDPFAGLAVISHTRIPAQGSWEFSVNGGVIWNLMPESLSDDNALVLSSDAMLRFLPAPDYSGQPAGLTTRLWDGRWLADGANVDITEAVGALGGFSNNDNLLNVTIDVVSVNDAPTFTAQNPPPSSAGSGPQTVPAWATFNPGASNESAQLPNYEVISLATPGLFMVPPSVDPSGNLNYTPATSNVGSTTFQVRVRDNGGTANGGVDLSPAQTFTLQIVGDEIFGDGFEN